MNLPRFVRERRQLRPADPRQIIATWTEPDVLDGNVVDAWVIIFRTRGCYWARASGCSMCGYVNDVATDVSREDLLHQLGAVVGRHRGQPIAKVYTSGNFFDEREVVPEARRAILKELGERCDKVLVETLSHLVRPELVEEAMSYCDRLELALGLETSDDAISRHSVNKFWGLDDHARAATIAHEAGATVKTYLMIKPPFLSERDAIEDAVRSGHDADPHSDTISYNPMNVQNHTAVDYLFHRGAYRPPWLWSVVEVLERTRDLQAYVKCHPTAGGLRRGAHNCGTCDRRVVRAIEEFSLRLRHDFDDLDCACRDTWRDYCELQPLMLTTADLPRVAA